MTFNTTLTVSHFEFFEHFRNRWIIAYGVSFFILANLILYTGGSSPLQASGSLLSLVLLLVPIFSLIFGSISFTESLPFMELMTAQPVSRRDIYLGKYLGLSSSLSLSFLLGMGLSMLMRVHSSDHGMRTLTILLLLGVILSFVFVSISFFLSNLSKRKEIIFGLALTIWFYLFVLHNLITFSLVVNFGDYPIDYLIFIMSALNPIDIVRVILTLQMDLSSLMGVSGAVMNKFFGGTGGMTFGIFMLLLWMFIPLVLGIRIFNKKNL